VSLLAPLARRDGEPCGLKLSTMPDRGRDGECFGVLEMTSAFGSLDGEFFGLLATYLL
jgi:hypothetical protein